MHRNGLIFQSHQTYKLFKFQFVVVEYDVEHLIQSMETCTRFRVGDYTAREAAQISLRYKWKVYVGVKLFLL